jgi:polysaccharide deacetylase 2 family uncharacterized protein YibQ
MPDDDRRASTMLEVARTIASDDPKRAAELLVEVQRRNKPIDDEQRLNLISAQVSSLPAARRSNSSTRTGHAYPTTATPILITSSTKPTPRRILFPAARNCHYARPATS